jgi:hypothetical protein
MGIGLVFMVLLANPGVEHGACFDARLVVF